MVKCFSRLSIIPVVVVSKYEMTCMLVHASPFLASPFQHRAGQCIHRLTGQTAELIKKLFCHSKVRLKIFEHWGKFHHFLSVNSKSENPIWHRIITHVKIFSLYFSSFWWFWPSDRKLEYHISKCKCQASETMFIFYSLNTWWGLLPYELLQRCSVTWRWSACGSV